MKKKYYLFGAMVCRAMEEGIKNALKVAKNEGYAIYEWNETSSPTALLLMYEGWDGFLELTEKQYKRFQTL